MSNRKLMINMIFPFPFFNLFVLELEYRIREKNRCIKLNEIYYLLVKQKNETL